MCKPYPFLHVASSEGRHHPDNEPISGLDYERARLSILKAIEQSRNSQH